MIDQRGIPSERCICGCNVIKVAVIFEQGEIVWYTLQGHCYQCNAPLTVPTPEDVVA